MSFVKTRISERLYHPLLRCSCERTPIDEALNHMRCDDILGVINAATSSGGMTPNEGSFEFDAAEAEGGSAFPQKPQ